MRLVVQRVNKASVAVNKKIVGKIGKGYLVLLGVQKGDGQKQVEVLTEKLAKLRVMSDENNKMNLSITDAQGEVLVVSQFTLYADTSKGNRPSFIKAAVPDLAKKLYKDFVNSLIRQGIKTKTGQFGEYMDIGAELDGPVTIILEA